MCRRVLGHSGSQPQGWNQPELNEGKEAFPRNYLKSYLNKKLNLIQLEKFKKKLS